MGDTDVLAPTFIDSDGSRYELTLPQELVIKAMMLRPPSEQEQLANVVVEMLRMRDDAASEIDATT